MIKTKKAKSNRGRVKYALTEKQKLQKREYYLALGEFINVFSDMEATLILALCNFAKLDKKSGRAIFSGVRVDQASDFIRRLGNAKKIKKAIFADLNDYLLPQIKAITDLRNDIIHYGARIKSQSRGLTVDNQRGIGRTQIRRYGVSARLLKAATDDLFLIHYRLLMAANGETASSPIFTAYGPWRYKRRPAPKVRPQSDRKRGDSSKPQARPRPPQSSGA